MTSEFIACSISWSKTIAGRPCQSRDGGLSLLLLAVEFLALTMRFSRLTLSGNWLWLHELFDYVFIAAQLLTVVATAAVLFYGHRLGEALRRLDEVSRSPDRSLLCLARPRSLSGGFRRAHNRRPGRWEQAGVAVSGLGGCMGWDGPGDVCLLAVDRLASIELDAAHETRAGDRADGVRRRPGGLGGRPAHARVMAPPEPLDSLAGQRILRLIFKVTIY